MKTGTWLWQEGFHEHSISNEDAVVDLEYYIHHNGARSRLVFHNQNSAYKTLGFVLLLSNTDVKLLDI